MYINGEEVAKDYVRAHKWANLGATSGDGNAGVNLQIVATRMNPEQISEAQRLARNCLARQFKGCD